jgi:hypothetical protein
MKFAKRLFTLIIVPVLFLAGCSGLPLSFSFRAQKPGVVTAVNPAPTSITIPNSAPTAAPTMVPTQASLVQPAVVKDVATTQALQAPAGDLAAFQTALEAVFKKVNPSVVSIQVVEQAATTGNRGRGFLNIDGAWFRLRVG